MALKFLGGGGSLVAIAATLNGCGRSFANIARLGPRVDAAVASAVFAGVNAALARAPSQGLLGPYNRAWLVTRAAALLGVPAGLLGEGWPLLPLPASRATVANTP